MAAARSDNVCHSENPSFLAPMEISVPPSRISRRARTLNALYRRLLKSRTFEAFDIAAARRTIARFDRLLGGMAPHKRSIADANGVPTEWIPAGVTPSRVLLYLHGGGFMFRTPRTHGRLAARLARLLDARALVPDYRLAPEHPLPAAHEDCFAAYRWLLGQGYDPARIALLGDSAGGLLVLSTLQRIRDAGLPRPACAMMFSPAADLADAASLDAADLRDDPMIGPGLLELVQTLVIAPIDANDPALSPCAGSLAGLPPLLIQVGSTEALLGQAVKTAELARAAGTSVDLQICPQMPHVFQAVSWLPETRRALAQVRDFVMAHAPVASPSHGEPRI